MPAISLLESGSADFVRSVQEAAENNMDPDGGDHKTPPKTAIQETDGVQDETAVGREFSSAQKRRRIGVPKPAQSSISPVASREMSSVRADDEVPQLPAITEVDPDTTQMQDDGPKQETIAGEQTVQEDNDNRSMVEDEVEIETGGEEESNGANNDTDPEEGDNDDDGDEGIDRASYGASEAESDVQVVEMDQGAEILEANASNGGDERQDRHTPNDAYHHQLDAKLEDPGVGSPGGTGASIFSDDAANDFDPSQETGPWDNESANSLDDSPTAKFATQPKDDENGSEGGG